MKRSLWLILFVLLCATSCIKITTTRYENINPSEKKQLRSYKLKEANINTMDFLSQRDKTPQIYRLDSLQLTKIVATTSKKQILLVAYSCWCAASTDIFDSIVNSIDTNNTALCLISTDNYSFKRETEQFLLSHNYFHPTFMLDLKLYGSGINFNTKFLNFAKQMFPNIDLKTGLNSCFLLDPSMEVMYGGSIDEFLGMRAAIKNH